MEWIKYSKYNMPPQGLKILCFKKGDLWIARRFEYKGDNYWIEFSFTPAGDSANARATATSQPDYWLKVQLPEGYTGYMKVKVGEGPIMTIDELQANEPDFFEEFIEAIVLSSSNRLPSIPLD